MVQSIRSNTVLSAKILVLVLQASLCTVGRAHAQQPPTAPESVLVDSVAVEGNVRLADLPIISLGGLTPGVAYTIYDIQRAFKTMWASGQFDSISVRVDGLVGSGAVTLVWVVAEQDLLRNVSITGLTSIDSGEVGDTTGLVAGQPYSPAAVLKAKDFIRGELAAQGIPFANIEERVEPLVGRSKEIILFLDVEEGTRVTIADVAFNGNTVFSDGELRAAMSLQPEGFFWWRSGSYDRERFDEDLQVNLPSHYAAQGYLDFVVVGDSLIIDPTTGKTLVEVSVDEGVQYRLRNFSIAGNSEFPTADLEQVFQPERTGLFAGPEADGTELPVFDNAAFQEATETVGRRYQNEGYISSFVEPFIRQNPIVEGEAPSVDVGWIIEEGPQAYVNRVNIEGNEYTYERVIRDKIFVLPGDVYSLDRILQSFNSISSLGYFEVPMDVPSIVPTPAGDVDVTFNVTEQATGAVNFGTSIGGGTGGLSGFIGYDQPNLWGKGKSGSLRWDFGEFQNNQVFSYTDPGVFESLVSANVNLFNARDRFITFRSGRRRRTGGDFRLGFVIPGARFTRFFAGYGLSRTRLTLSSGGDDTSLFGRGPGTQSTFSAGITRSTLNHPLFPTDGSRQSVNVAFTGGPLGGDGKFVKYTADGSWWLQIGSTGGEAGGAAGGTVFALGMTMRFGALQGNNDAFPFDRFWLGGVQFGEQLRGYDETTITPRGFFDERTGQIRDIDRLGNAFFSMTTELAMRVGAQMSISVFMDAGNVWRNAAEIDPTQLFRGAGIGAQLVTPFGPFGLDYAYGFDKTEPGWQLHFRLGGM